MLSSSHTVVWLPADFRFCVVVSRMDGGGEEGLAGRT